MGSGNEVGKRQKLQQRIINECVTLVRRWNSIQRGQEAGNFFLQTPISYHLRVLS